MQRKLVVSIVLLLALAAAAAANAASSPYEIQLLGGSFTPAPGTRPVGLKDLSPGRKVHVLLQLHEIPVNFQDLSRAGVDVGPYASGRAWIASVPAAALNAIGSRPDVRALVLWDAPRKVHPRVTAGDFAPWARDESRPGWVMLFVQLHHDVPIENGYALADAVGGAAMPPVEGLHGLTIWVTDDKVQELASSEDVLWIQEGPPPLTPTNDGARSNMRVDAVNAAPYNLTGSGVRAFVFDAGTARSTHETFNPGTGSRVTVIDAQASADHPTHVAGTVGGDGAPSSAGGRGRGVATGASILSAGYQQVGGTMFFWDNAGDIEVDYTLGRNTHNADLITNSIGSNTAANGYPCDREGDYDLTGSLLDGIVRDDNPSINGSVILTWAAGNERSGGSPRGRCGANYRTTAPPSCAKNPIHVGAINSDGSSMTAFSSWGPCDDGRMKPVISAPGCESGRVTGETSIFSSLNTTNTAYGGACGTSMATPAVAGAVTLMIEDWRSHGHGGVNDQPLPALVKSWLIHGARDLGEDGPDFIYGYGAVNIQKSVDILRAGNGTLGDAATAWGTDSATNGSVDNYFVTVAADTAELKATLAWDDAAAAAFAA
ncbi:MAG TPA: S8 family serine peptidase, partial [Thermoanaerobaculia bacterium]|nr:S8 family serine peptidase [Thermoanaerobaculia bacterium]